MTMPDTSRTYTPDDLLRIPDGDGYELVDGHLLERNSSIEASAVAAQISCLLGEAAAHCGDVSVYSADLGYDCFPGRPNHIRRPKVSLVRKDRMKGWQGDRAYMPIPADLAVEVVCPSDSYHDIAQKVAEYLGAGFAVVWVVNPHLKTMRIERAGGAITLLDENDEITGGLALPEFRCKVGDFF